MSLESITHLRKHGSTLVLSTLLLCAGLCHGQPAAARDGYELHLYESVALRDGRHANNPWLHELPDPASKMTWGNYAAISPKLARSLGLSDGDVVRVTSERGQVEIPVFTQPGQQEGTISIALGYGRKQVGRVGRKRWSKCVPVGPGDQSVSPLLCF